MATALYCLKIRNKRDVLLARQRARQLTGLLGYADGDQLLLASAAFELAWTTYQSRGRVALHFTLENGCLRISCSPRAERGRSGAARLRPRLERRREAASVEAPPGSRLLRRTRPAPGKAAAPPRRPDAYRGRRLVDGATRQADAAEPVRRGPAVQSRTAPPGQRRARATRGARIAPPRRRRRLKAGLNHRDTETTREDSRQRVNEERGTENRELTVR